MTSAASTSEKSSTRVRWMWNAGEDLFSTSKRADWCRYSDIENMIIEKAFSAGESHAILDEYHIDLKHNLQISNNDADRQRPVKRMACDKDNKILREERFLPNPVAPDCPFGGQYGFISPFIKEVVKDLNITRERLPSKDKTVVPMIIEKAALGIIDEGKIIGKKREAEEIANQLLEKKNADIKEIWKCCAYLYTLESFLYKKSNEVMRLIGSEQHEQIWRSKIRTLGPFCLLLWDNPFNRKLAKPGTILYRGTTLPNDMIALFKAECSQNLKSWHSFQAFTSCSRKRSVAENFGDANVLFIMNIRLAFTVDLTNLSEYKEEEEELLLPGVSFTIDDVEFDEKNRKHLVYLTLQQRHNRTDEDHIDKNATQSIQKNTSDDFFDAAHELAVTNDDAFLIADDNDEARALLTEFLAARADAELAAAGDDDFRDGHDYDWN